MKGSDNVTCANFDRNMQRVPGLVSLLLENERNPSDFGGMSLFNEIVTTANALE